MFNSSSIAEQPDTVVRPSCCTVDHHYVQILQEFPSQKLFGYLGMILCGAGLFTNFFNIIVFRDKEMISPLNNILAAVAICDFIVSLVLIPYLYKAYLEPFGFPDTKCLSSSWMVYFYAFFIIYVIVHDGSVLLTVLAGIWRYIAVVYPLRSQTWCCARNTYAAVITIFLFNLLRAGMIPYIVQIKIISIPVYKEDLSIDHKVTSYTYMVKTDVSKDLFFNMVFVISALSLHFAPSVISFVISIRLWYTLPKTRRVHRELTNSSASKNEQTKRQISHTTRMLLVILLLLLATELPATVFDILNSMFVDKHYYEECAPKISELYQILWAFNSAMTFFAYYFMSAKFRTTFKVLFTKKKEALIRDKGSMDVAISSSL